jgi:hypothetical protein
VCPFGKKRDLKLTFKPIRSETASLDKVKSRFIAPPRFSFSLFLHSHSLSFSLCKMVKTTEQHAIDTVRVLAADVVRGANSGHPGAPMGCAPMAHVLFNRHINVNPKNPTFLNRDRFVLSNGHGCALQYVLLHLLGFDVSMDDLKQFRQLGSK